MKQVPFPLSGFETNPQLEAFFSFLLLFFIICTVINCGFESKAKAVRSNGVLRLDDNEKKALEMSLLFKGNIKEMCPLSDNWAFPGPLLKSVLKVGKSEKSQIPIVRQAIVGFLIFLFRDIDLQFCLLKQFASHIKPQYKYTQVITYLQR